MMKRDDIETDAGDWLSVDSNRYDDIETDAGDYIPKCTANGSE